jgi:phosphoglycolate phosphatase
MSEIFPYSCVIYDLDGTLIDSRLDIAAALNQARAHFKLPEHNLDDVMPMIGHGLRHLVECGFANSEINIEQAFEVTKQTYQEQPCRFSKPFPGVLKTLEQLQECGIIQYIVSNKPTFLVPSVLQNLNMTTYFKQAFGGEDFPKRKPNPMAIEYILEQEPKLNKKDLLMVGDMNPDLEMANRAGIDSAFCQFGYATSTLKASHQLQQFSDLLNLTSSCS